jgi:hypothetical protein
MYTFSIHFSYEIIMQLSKQDSRFWPWLGRTAERIATYIEQFGIDQPTVHWKSGIQTKVIRVHSEMFTIIQYRDHFNDDSLEDWGNSFEFAKTFICSWFKDSINKDVSIKIIGRIAFDGFIKAIRSRHFSCSVEIKALLGIVARLRLKANHIIALLLITADGSAGMLLDLDVWSTALILLNGSGDLRFANWTGHWVFYQ